MNALTAEQKVLAKERERVRKNVWQTAHRLANPKSEEEKQKDCARAKAWYAANRAKVISKYRVANPRRIKLYLDYKEYYTANKEKILERAKAWYAENKKAKKEYDASYRTKNRHKLNEKAMAWRKKNLVQQRGKEADRRAINPEKYAKAAREWREKNADTLRAYESVRARTEKRRAVTRKSSDAWKVAHPEERRNSVRNRRAKIKDGGILSSGIESKLMQAQKGKCPVCHVDIRKRFHLDHIFPVAKGGRNEDNNAQLLCPPCNQSKSDMLPHEFMQSRGLLL